MIDKDLKNLNDAIKEKYKYAFEEYDYPTNDDALKVLILNSIKQTELLQQILLGMKGVEHQMQNGWAHFNREIEGIIRRTK